MTALSESFVPANQLEWTELFRPPAGYRTESAIGTTYGLDFTALCALLLAMLDKPTGEAAWEEHANRMHAITSAGDRVVVLAQRTRIQARLRRSNGVFGMLDRVVREVIVPGASFHPKVWVLKFSPRREIGTGQSSRQFAARDPAIYRFLCSSRNATLGGNWEAAVCLNGTSNPGLTSAVGENLGAFFTQALSGITDTPASVETLVRELKNVRFETNGGRIFKNVDFFWQGPERSPLIQALPARGKRALVVSPFIQAGMLRELARRFAEVWVVGRQQDLDAIWSPELGAVVPIRNVWVVNPSLQNEDLTSAPRPRSLDLHAKLLFCEYSREGKRSLAETWLGSANCSPRGWGLGVPRAPGNCEAMVRLSPGIRPQDFIIQFGTRDTGEPNGWLSRYLPGPPRAETDETRIEDRLDAAQSAFAAIALSGELIRTPEGFVLALATRDRVAWERLLHEHSGVVIEACPISRATSPYAPFASLLGMAAGAVHLDAVALSMVSSLVLVRLVDSASGNSRTFAIRLELSLDADILRSRQAAFLRENLKAADFRGFLRAILLNDSASVSASPAAEPRDRDSEEADDGNPKTPRGTSGGLLEDLSVETILQSCTADLARVDEVDRLLSAFEGSSLIDDSFHRFWKSFREGLRLAGEGTRA